MPIQQDETASQTHTQRLYAENLELHARMQRSLGPLTFPSQNPIRTVKRLEVKWHDDPADFCD